jgi:hypothetical protein
MTKKQTTKKREAVALTREAKKREIRLVKHASAKRALDNFGQGTETFCVTHGQFSLMDAVQVLLEKIGPCDVAMSTWTAGAADLTRSAAALNDGHIKTMRMVVDCSFGQRQPGYLNSCRALYGDEAIRSIRTHLKFVVLTNENYNVAVRTSMNLNENPRMEYIEVSDNKELCDFFLQIVDQIFEEEAIGDFSTKVVPVLRGMVDTKEIGMVTVGKL